MTVNNLIKKIILLCVIEVLLEVSIYYAIPADQNGYIAAIQDKESLLFSSKSPRIIFVGGSNLAFGLDSELVEKEFGRPVINFGLHADLGIETSLNIVERYIGQGDIFVIIPEYEFFNGNSPLVQGSNDILADFLELDPANVQYLARAKQINLPLIAFSIPERKVNRELNSLLAGPMSDIYIRSSFNSHGDVVAHLGKTPFDPNKIPANRVLQDDLALSTAPFALLEEFHQKVIHKGGIVLFDFPSLRMRNCENTGWEKFDNLVRILKARTTIPVLSTPYDRCYPDNYFFDTDYHLTGMGREIRTQQVIENLYQILKK